MSEEGHNRGQAEALGLRGQGGFLRPGPSEAEPGGGNLGADRRKGLDEEVESLVSLQPADRDNHRTRVRRGLDDGHWRVRAERCGVGHGVGNDGTALQPEAFAQVG